MELVQLQQLSLPLISKTVFQVLYLSLPQEKKKVFWSKVVRTGNEADANPYNLKSLSDLQSGGWDAAPTSSNQNAFSILHYLIASSIVICSFKCSFWIRWSSKSLSSS